MPTARGMWTWWDPDALPAGVQNGAATLQTSLAVLFLLNDVPVFQILLLDF